MRILSAEEVERLFGLSADQVGVLERDASRGVLHGEPSGEAVRGRPLKFGQEMRQVGFKEPLQTVEAIDDRAREPGMQRSEYLRFLVDSDLAQGACGARGGVEKDSEPVMVKWLAGKRGSRFLERWEKRSVLGARDGTAGKSGAMGKPASPGAALSSEEGRRHASLA